MSWAPAAGIMKRDCCVLAPDLRGHGLTSSTDDSLLSLEDLAKDIVSLLVEIFRSGVLIDRRSLAPPQPQSQSPLVTEVEDLTPTGDSSEFLKPSERRTPTDNERTASVGMCRHRIHDGRTAPRGCSDGAADSIGEREPIGTSRPVDSGTDETSIDGAEVDGSTGCAESSEGVCDKDKGVGRPRQYAGGGNGGHSDGCTKVLLVGHSLGGSIAVRVAEAAAEVKRRCEGRAEIAGVVAVDVVEGTALTALDDMPEVRNLALLIYYCTTTLRTEPFRYRIFLFAITAPVSSVVWEPRYLFLVSCVVRVVRVSSVLSIDTRNHFASVDVRSRFASALYRLHVRC